MIAAGCTVFAGSRRTAGGIQCFEGHLTTACLVSGLCVVAAAVPTVLLHHECLAFIHPSPLFNHGTFHHDHKV